ncbi:MAG TPA: hypothetical protein VMC83_17250 [Streptosporangiaceae bacterium]|nr:hypothetical protein [Streptosporangiaceae bacterium]
MPSLLHEAPLELLRRNPGLAAAMLTGIPGVAVPEGGPASLAPGEVTASLPVELRADAVVLLAGTAGKLAVVTEVQTSAGAIKKKRRVWPAYLTQARAQHDCPTVLMIFCRDRAVARACAKPIPTGHPQFVLTPIVIGPDDVPDAQQQETAQAGAELTMMAAWAGSTDLRDPVVQVRTLEQLAGLDAETLATYTRIVLMAAPDKSSRRALEALMATVFKNEFLDKLEAEAKARGEAAGLERGEAMGLARGEAMGLARGRAQTILQVLAARGIDVPAEIRDQVLACTDIAQLDAWSTKAATAQTIAQVFGEASGTP